MTLIVNIMEPTQSLVDNILDQLSEFDPYIHKQNTESVYIHFDSLPNGMTHKLRISNHEERAKYGYKWQLRLDGVPPPKEHKQYVRYFDDADSLVKAFLTYYTKVQCGGTTTPITRNDNVWD